MTRTKKQNLMLTGASLLALSFASSVVHAQDEVTFDINAQPLAKALMDFNEQSGLTVAAPRNLVEGKIAAEVHGEMEPDEALNKILINTGLISTELPTGAYTITLASAEEAPGRTGPFRVVQVDQGSSGGVETVADNGDADVDQKKDEIVVTGTNIRGGSPVGSQLLTFDREELDLKGYATVPEFIQNLTQNFNGGISESTASTANGSSDNTTAGSGINLRGLGNTSTLVLLNGRRMAPSGDKGSFVDISLIPVAAIDRVEVLTDGASAIYGSDAIGGVVNFVLRKDYDGAETRVRHGFATQGGLSQYQVGQTIGKNWGNGYGLISYEYFHREPLKGEDRAFSNTTLDGYELLPEQKRHSVFANAGLNVTENIELFATGFYNVRDSEQFDFRTTPTRLGFTSGDTEQYGGSLGASRDFGNSWQGEIIGSYSRTETIFRIRELTEAPIESEIIGRRSSAGSVDAKLDGPLFKLPGGDAKLALGGHYRHEVFGDNFDELGVADPSLNIIPIPDFDRDVFAFFGELYAPLVTSENSRPGVERLEFSISGRYENYSDFGSSVDPKIGASWSPIDGLSIRGAWGTSFRAPLLTDLDEGRNSNFLVNSVPNPSSPSGTSLVAYLLGFGNVELQPETATTWTAGFDFQPPQISGLELSATYFDINYKNRIALPEFGLLEVLTNPLFAPVLDLSPDPDFLAGIDPTASNSFNFTSFPGFGPLADFVDAEIFADGRVQNLASERVQGIDVALSYGLDTDNVGAWNFDLSGTYLFEIEEQLFQTTPSVNVVDTIDNAVDLRLNGNVSWSLNGFFANLGVNYVDGYTNDKNAPTAPVASWTTANISVGYDTGEGTPGLLANTRILFNVRNLFNQDPPFVTTDFAATGVNPIFFDPNAANPDGRVLSFQITKQW